MQISAIYLHINRNLYIPIVFFSLRDKKGREIGILTIIFILLLPSVICALFFYYSLNLPLWVIGIIWIILAWTTFRIVQDTDNELTYGMEEDVRRRVKKRIGFFFWVF
jgi:amino acid transporter